MRLPVDYGSLLFSGFLFGMANAISHGHWQPVALVLLIGTLGFIAWRFAVAGKPERHGETFALSKIALAGVVGLLAILPITAFFDPKIVSQSADQAVVVRVTEVVSLLLLASYLPSIFGRWVESSAFKTARFFLFAALVIAVGVSVIQLNPRPGIDVWTLQMRGVEVLREGKNPFTWATVPDTDPENDFVNPYNYPPMTLYWGLFSVLFGGDVRYGNLFADITAGILIRFIARSGKRADVPAIIEDAPTLVFWLTPLLAMILELAWIDGIQIVLITAGVAAFVAERKTLAAIVFGLAISSKQSMFWIYPLACVVLRLNRRQWVIMAIAALIPVLPFLLWDFKALKAANFDFMVGLNPRRDALCFTNAMWQWFRFNFPPSTGFLLGAMTVAVACLRRWAATTLDFTRTLVITYFVFFFFNRWAFANYYFLLTGLSALGTATAVYMARSKDFEPRSS